MAKTLEEIEAIHAARAARKGQPTGEVTGESGEPLDDNDDYHPADDGNRHAVEDERDREIAALRQQLDAANGRAAPAQRQSEEFRRLYDEERRSREHDRNELNRQVAMLQEQLNARRVETSLDELLSPEEREVIDPMQLEIIKKVASAVVNTAAPKVDVQAETAKYLQKREAEKIQRYREDLLTDPRKGLTTLAALAEDPKFISWTSEEGNEDFDPLVRSMLTATTESEIDRYAKAVAKRVAKYNESRNTTHTGTRSTDARTSLNRAMQRRPRQLSNDEMGDKLAQAKQLARSRNPADRKKAQDILNSI